MTHPEPIVKINGLTRHFGSVRALDHMSMEIEPGGIVGLLGSNGGGKSTLIRHIIGLLLPETGNCTTFGRETGKLGPADLARIGYVHQEGELIGWMTVRQMIRFVAAYYPNWDRELEEDYLARFEVPVKTRVGALSPGQRQKLAILLALGFHPELLILDEPAAALDPLARSRFFDLLIDFVQTPGRTILISSHILTDVEKVIDHVIIMDEGRTLRDCSLDDLREEFCRFRITSLNGSLPDNLPFGTAISCERGGGQAVVTLKSPSPGKVEAGARELNTDLEWLPLSLEEIYQLVLEGN